MTHRRSDGESTENIADRLRIESRNKQRSMREEDDSEREVSDSDLDPVANILGDFSNECGSIVEAHCEGGKSTEQYKKKVEAVHNLCKVKAGILQVWEYLDEVTTDIMMLPHASLEELMKRFARSKGFRAFVGLLENATEDLMEMEEVWNDMVVPVPVTAENLVKQNASDFRKPGLQKQGGNGV